MTAAQVWERLVAAGIAHGDVPQAAAARSPWFVRAMLGVAGWFGALFLLLFVGFALEFLLKSAGASLVAGIVACAAATALFRAAPQNDFASQFGFAISLAGQALIVFGLASATDGKTLAAVGLMTWVVEAILFWLVPSYVHRVWTACIGACALALAFVDRGLVFFAPGIVTAGFAWVALKEFGLAKHGALARPAGYGLALAVIAVAVLHSGLWFTWIFDRPKPPVGGLWGAWIGAAFTGAVFVWTVVRLLAREGLPMESTQSRIALAGAAIVALATLKAPGIGPAAAVLLLGFANGNRVLAGLGVLGLLAYLSNYYYSLQWTLLEKSLLLACTGVTLLGVRLAVQRYWPGAETKEALHA